MKSLSRRSVTTGLAAAVTAIPALGLAKGTKADLSADAELLEHGERCKALALEMTRLGNVFEEAFYATTPERWCCGLGCMGAGLVAPVVGVANAWQVFAVDLAPRWFALHPGTEAPEHLPTKWKG